MNYLEFKPSWLFTCNAIAKADPVTFYSALDFIFAQRLH